MFIDQIKVYARAGHGGKGCVAFHREAYITKGGPSGGNGGRGGNVILQADHDLNNLIGQYYVPRLIAQVGESGMGKGMDGHAGKDLLIKVPCGTLVWKLPSAPVPEEEAEEDTDETAEQRPALGVQKRPVIRHSGKERALEINLEEEAEEPKGTAPTHEGEELVADLTVDGQQFVLCKAVAAAWAIVISPPRAGRHRASRNPANRATKGNFVLNCD